MIPNTNTPTMKSIRALFLPYISVPLVIVACLFVYLCIVYSSLCGISSNVAQQSLKRVKQITTDTSLDTSNPHVTVQFVQSLIADTKDIINSNQNALSHAIRSFYEIVQYTVLTALAAQTVACCWLFHVQSRRLDAVGSRMRQATDALADNQRMLESEIECLASTWSFKSPVKGAVSADSGVSAFSGGTAKSKSTATSSKSGSSPISGPSSHTSYSAGEGSRKFGPKSGAPATSEQMIDYDFALKLPLHMDRLNSVTKSVCPENLTPRLNVTKKDNIIKTVYGEFNVSTEEGRAQWSRAMREHEGGEGGESGGDKFDENKENSGPPNPHNDPHGPPNPQHDPHGPGLPAIVPPLTTEELKVRLEEADKKQYRRLFIPGRGWVSVKRLQEETAALESQIV